MEHTDIFVLWHLLLWDVEFGNTPTANTGFEDDKSLNKLWAVQEPYHPLIHRWIKTDIYNIQSEPDSIKKGTSTVSEYIL